MKKELPIYRLTINALDTDESEVNYVALVDEPAIEQTWLAFDKAQHLFKEASPERRIITGALMVADMPIYRRDNTRGEYYVVFDKPTIEMIVQKFFRKGYTSNVNLMHDETKQADGVYMFESFIIDKERGISTPKGFETIPDGSWFGSFKVDNITIYDEFIKTGIFKGFSVEGIFNYDYNEQDEAMNEIMSIISNNK